jgi:hypothetical protein
MLKSTQIVIEQLFIGLFFFLIIGIFLVGRKILPTEWPGSFPDSWALGAFLFIAAYAAGVVIDRLSDTLLDKLFSINRIKAVSKRLTWPELERFSVYLLDPYPEACLRMEIYDKGGGIAEHHAYLRTRIRITRAITCLLPAFFISLQTAYYVKSDQHRYYIGLLTLLTYLLLIIVAIVTDDKYSIPKSYKIDKFKEYIEKRCGDCGNDTENNIKLKINRTEWICQPGSGLIIFVIISVVIAYNFSWIKSPPNMRPDLFPALLPLITLLAGRAWWRISKTFFNLLLNFKDYRFSKNCQNVKAIPDASRDKKKSANQTDKSKQRH